MAGDDRAARHAALGMGVAAAAAVLVVDACRRWRALGRAPADTGDTRRLRLRGFHAPAGDFTLFGRTQLATSEALPPLLLVHGLVVSSKVMEPLIARLQGSFRVLAPDLPGMGESSKRRPFPDVTEMADALANWLRGLGIRRTAVFGLSFGCNVVANLAVRHPDLVERLVLQGPAPDPSGRFLPTAVLRDLRNARREPRSSWSIAKVDYAKAGLAGAGAAIRLALTARLEDNLPQVRVPTQVICGDRDLVGPVDWARHLAGLLPDGRLTVLRDAAHVLPYGEPDRLAEAMLPFLRAA